jgi:hypothetical protein
MMISTENFRAQRLRDGRYRIAFHLSNYSTMAYFKEESQALAFLKEVLRAPKDEIYNLFLTTNDLKL